MVVRGKGRPRITALWLALAGLLLCAVAGLKTTALLGHGRSAALDVAGQAITRATVPRIEQRRVPSALVDAVAGLIREPRLALNYVTIKNAAGATLVSRGRLAGDLNWLPARSARQWRGWLYRLRSAETTRVLRRNGARVGTIRYGVQWLAVFTRAGLALLLWLVLLVCGLLMLGRGLAQGRSQRAARPPAAGRTPRGLARHAFAKSRDALPTTSLARLLRRALRHDDFAPIPDYAVVDRPETTAAPVADAPINTPRTGETDARTADRGSHPATTTAAPEADVAARSVTPEAAAPIAPRSPRKLGDTTLDLRFYPIWRGSERRTLAGAVAALAWRSAADETVDAMTLTQLAEAGGALRAFTQWIVQRFSMLHSNWRTLELATVPILLPIPSALLGFTDAEAVWRTALRRIDRDPNDLILHVRQEGASGPSLPIRRALGLNACTMETTLPSAPADIVCVIPEMLPQNTSAAVAQLDRLRRPILLGPVVDPEAWTSIIEKDNVCWFSDIPGPDNLHTPRSFGRLLATYHTAPI